MVKLLTILPLWGLSGCIGAPEACHGCWSQLDGQPVVDAPTSGETASSDAAEVVDRPAGDVPSEGPPLDAGVVDRGPSIDAPPDQVADVGGAEKPDSAADLPAEKPPEVLPNLIAYYPFDEVSGTTAADASGKGRNATLSGGAVFSGGMVRNAVALNGTTAYVTLPDHLLDQATQLTIAFWVKINSDRVWGRLFDFGNDTNVNMYLTSHALTPPVIRLAITKTSIPGEQRLEGPSMLPVGVWKHIAVVMAAGGGATLYVDGASVASAPSVTMRPPDLATTTVNNWIGRSQYRNDPYLEGQLDEFRVYDRALTASEIAMIQGLR